VSQKAVDELNDLGDELILLDDDDPIKYARRACLCAGWDGRRSPCAMCRIAVATPRYNFGECYLEVTKDRAEGLIEELLVTKRAALSVSEDELAQCKSTLQDLKNQLYARFGTNINLEE
jgi:hypothetical protein